MADIYWNLYTHAQKHIYFPSLAHTIGKETCHG